MDAHIRKVYVPMTETGFYILLCLRETMHGYGIVQKVEALTQGKIYCITDLGNQVLELEMKRIERLYRTMTEVENNEK